jgi:PAS domain S-box-containing protein
MRLFKDISIKTKLIRISLFTAGFALFLSFMAITANEVMVFKKDILKNLSIQSEIIGRNCTAALTFNDAKAASEILSALKANSNVEFALIYKKDGELFADYSRDNKKHDIPIGLKKGGHRFSLNSAEVYNDIILDNMVTGSIYIHSDLNVLYDNLFRYAGVFLAVILLSLYLVLAMSGRLHETVTALISNLIRTMNDISEKKDYSVRATVQSKDEVGALAEGFNAMLAKIQERDSELDVYRKNLEELVANRTEQLKTLNNQLLKELTEREKAEAALQALTWRYQAILSSVPDIIMEVDTNKVYTWANKSGYEFFGGDVIGKEAAFYFEGEQQTYNMVQPLFNGSEDMVYVESWQRRKDSEKRLLAWWCRVLKNSAGNVTGALSTARDITEHKKMEDELKKSEEFNRSILETVDEGFIVIDPEFRIISANKAYLNMINKTGENVIGGYCYKLSHGLLEPCCEGGEDCAVSRTLKTGKPQTAAHTHYDEAGHPIFVEIKSFPVKDGSGKVVAAIEVINNITERKKLEDQLRHSQKMEAVGTLAGGIAHDFNNILNVIIGYGTMTLNRLGDDPLAREQINEVLAAADRAAVLTKRLLAFSRKQVVDMKPVNLNETILGMEKMFSRIIGEDIAITIELADRNMVVMADAGQMEQVLMNLISNARDAMPKGGRLTISTGIKEVDDDFVAAYGYGKTGTYALVSVTDTGCGVDAETAKKIFEPFFTTKGIGKGTGLGLAIAYGIIKQHDGYIQVYSEMGEGTTFRILLPVMEEETAKVQEVEAVVPIKGGTETILLAEDDASVRNLLRIILESFGYTVITAEDGEDAITKYRENMDSIQLLVLDMIMPKKNGKEAYAEIKNITPDIKAIFVSGYTMDIIHQKELLDDVMDFILKPVSPKDLLKKVREALDR